MRVNPNRSAAPAAPPAALPLQACMQVALASKTRAPPYVVDTRASLFLSLGRLARCSQLQALPPVVQW